MKFQSIIRIGIVFAGMATAFTFLAGTTKAQEITNTEFNDGPNVAPLAEPAASQQSASLALSGSDAMRAGESIANVEQPDEMGVLRVAAKDANWVTISLLMGIGLVSLYALAEAKRARRNFNSGRGPYVSTRNV